MSISVTGSGPPTGSPPPPEPTPIPTPTPVDTGGELGLVDASTSALADAFDEPILTDIESGAEQLLSTCFPDGLSDPFSSAQGGWFAGWQDVDPYTDAPGSRDSISAFMAEDVDAFTGMVPEEGNTNPFTGGRDINPFTGSQNGSAFAVDGDSAKPSLILATVITPSVNESLSESTGTANDDGTETPQPSTGVEECTQPTWMSKDNGSSANL